MSGLLLQDPGHGVAAVTGWLRRHAGQAAPAHRRHRLDVVPGAPAGPALPPGVRRREPKDLGACARLLRVVSFEGHCPPEAWTAPRAWLSADDVLDAWVVDNLGEILGHVAVATPPAHNRAAVRWRELTGREPGELATVSRLFVRPRVRRRGVGSDLLAAALLGIRERGLVPVLELVNPGPDAVALCEARGWRLLAVDQGDAPAKLPAHRYAAPA